MRQGPDYRMQVRREEHPSVYIPYELMEEFEDVKVVSWRKNKDGTITLTLYDTF